MHDESPRSRRDRRSDDPTESAFDALGLNALLGDPTQENSVVDETAALPPTAAPVTPQPGSDEPAAEPGSDQVGADRLASERATSAQIGSDPLRSGLRPRRRDRADADAGVIHDAAPDAAAAGNTAATEHITTPEFPWHSAAGVPETASADSADAGPFSWSDTQAVVPAAPASEPTRQLPTSSAGVHAEGLSPQSSRQPVRARDLPPIDEVGSTDTVALPGVTEPSVGAADSVADTVVFAADAVEPTNAATADQPSATGAPEGLPAGGSVTSAQLGGWRRARGGGPGRGGSGRSGGSGSGGRGGSGSGGSGRGGSGGSGSGGRGGGPFAGILGWIRKNPRTSLIAGIAAGVVVLSGLSFGLGAATSPARAQGASASVTATATPTAKPTVRPTPSAVPAASKIRTCSVASYAADRGFGTLEAQVVNASTGEVLFDRNGANPAPTASVLKMLTAAAAYSILGPDYRVPTTVVKGAQPGQVVVIGGGDVTLTRLPTGQQSFYTDAPHLDDLANQVKQAWASDPANAGQPITSLVVDTSLYSGPVWQPSWDEHEERVVEGSTPYMTSFMVDGDRNNPSAVESPRSTDPVGRAANALADDLGGDVTVSGGTAPAGAKQLGQVLSQPVSALAEQALTYSDNTIMEELARLVAIKTGAGNSFSAINAGTLKGLETYGISESGLYFADGSGLSADNKVPASYLTQFMIKVLNRQGSLGSIYDGLPIAGKTGTLAAGYDRFDGSFSSNAVGHVNAKTGWINTARTLAGVIHAKDGTDLTFAVYALNYGGDDAALNAIDNLTTAFYECGNNLSNN